MRMPLDQMKIRELQFGTVNPISNTFGLVRSANTRAHQGWDLDAQPGTPVYAIADGTLTAGVSESYGLWIRLQFSHAGSTYYAFYAHLQPGSLTDGGTTVREGAQIARTGISGNASAIPAGEAHLHFEIRTVAVPASGLDGRVDPGEILGYDVYRSEA